MRYISGCTGITLPLHLKEVYQTGSLLIKFRFGQIYQCRLLHYYGIFKQAKGIHKQYLWNDSSHLIFVNINFLSLPTYNTNPYICLKPP